MGCSSHSAAAVDTVLGGVGKVGCTSFAGVINLLEGWRRVSKRGSRNFLTAGQDQGANSGWESDPLVTLSSTEIGSGRGLDIHIHSW